MGAQAWQQLGFDPIIPLLPAHSWHEALATSSVLGVRRRALSGAGATASLAAAGMLLRTVATAGGHLASAQ
jgi:hypothetical protein